MAHPKDLPSVSELLNEHWAGAAIQEHGRVLVTSLLRIVIETERKKLLKNSASWQSPDWATLLAHEIKNYRALATQRAVNGTGILLHTGLGRAVLPQKAVNALSRHLLGSTQLEINPITGKRSQRDKIAAEKICELFGGESALVVNNNAAATLLILHALSQDKEVIVSRGELVEIGGSFRLPEIMIQSQAKLKEVGATNKSRLDDFRSAVNENTGLIMKAHTSNYKIVGFTDEVSIEELIELGKEKKIPVVHDIGSGTFVDLEEYNLPHEPLARRSLKAGADLVFFSGDKLLGGPQAGIIIGKKKYVDLCRQNPLARALRVDKMILLALEATLDLYREGQVNDIPLYNRLNKTLEELFTEAEELKKQIKAPWSATIESATGEMGSGSVPTEEISSYRLVLNHDSRHAEAIASALRSNQVPIYGHIVNDKFGLNVISIFPEDHAVIIKALEGLN